MNMCFVSANDVMEHFAFPGNMDFVADDQGAFSCIMYNSRKMLLCIHSSSMKQCLQFVNHEQQAQQVPANLRRGRFSIETPLENAGLKFIELASASKKTTAKQRENRLAQRRQRPFKKKNKKAMGWIILGDPGADKVGEGKCKRAEKYIRNEEK